MPWPFSARIALAELCLDAIVADGVDRMTAAQIGARFSRKLTGEALTAQPRPQGRGEQLTIGEIQNLLPCRADGAQPPPEATVGVVRFVPSEAGGQCQDPVALIIEHRATLAARGNQV